MGSKHQPPLAKRVYQLRVQLQHIAPPVWRRILVPGSIKLEKLNRIVQAAMGWTNSHLHDWNIEQRRYGIPDKEWGGSDDMLDERKFSVGAILGEQVQTFGYHYDFGDGWEHIITVEDCLPAQEGRNDWPHVPGWRKRLPAGRCGRSTRFYLDFLDAMHHPTHEQHAGYWCWWGGPFDAKAFSINIANMASRKLR